MDAHRSYSNAAAGVARGGPAPVTQASASFGPFRLQAAQRLIERDGHPIQLSPRAFDILVALIDRAGTVVSKNDLMARVWPGVTIDEGSLRVHVASLRKALGDGQAGARYLSTVSGQGYCFVGAVSRTDGSTPSPAAAPPAQTHNLPARPRQIVGRDQMTDEIANELTSHRFVTVVGPGGIGKTTVAVHIAHALLGEFAGQVYMVDLGAIREEALVPSIVASTLGLPARFRDPSDNIVEFLRDKRILLILDCCEHVIETAAALAERLYKGAPQLHILATSRELLRVEGEHIHRLSPLASPPAEAVLTAESALAYPAVELFVERAKAGSGAFELTDATASDVGDICRRLDGIALAIELAASRVCAYGVKSMIELLDNQFNLLWEGRRTALPRHRTLHATIEWSYNLLSEAERVVLCRLSVFFGNFTLEAARSIATTEDADDAIIMAALAGLVAKSMLAPSGDHSSTRYRLLDATRTYAQDKLAASPDAEVMARRHASYFLGLLQGIGDSSGESLSGLTDQFSNIRGALTWCFSECGDRRIGTALAAAAMPLFLQLSLLAECQLWATRAIDALDGADGSIRHDLSLHAALGSARLLAGQIDDEATASLTRALRIAKGIGDVPSQIRLMDRLHLLQLFAGELDDALDTARRGEAIAAGHGDVAALAQMRVSLGISYHYVGDVRAARSCIDTVLQSPRQIATDGHGSSTFDYPGRAEITLARLLWLQGYPDQAAETARRAVIEAKTTNQPVKFCRALLWAFAVFYWNSQLDDYEEYVDRILVETRRYSLDALQILGEGARGVTLLAKGDIENGIVTLRGSVERMLGRRFGVIAGFSSPLALALAEANQGPEAIATIDQAIARARHHNFLMEMPDMLRVRGEVLSRMSNPDLAAAEHSMQQSVDLAQHQGALGYKLNGAVSLARLRLRQGRLEEAHAVLAPAYARFTEGFDTRLLTTARELLHELNSPHPGSAAIN